MYKKQLFVKKFLGYLLFSFLFSELFGIIEVNKPCRFGAFAVYGLTFYNACGIILEKSEKQSNFLRKEKYMYCWHNHPVRAVNHRGFNKEAPENTISAYRLSKEKGFLFVECDVSFTSDNVPVLLHDDTVNRTSNGRGKVSEMTFEALRRLDFGGWVSEKYAGEKIPTFEEFIFFCRNVGLYPYIELKEGFNKERAEMLMRLVRRYGMYGKVTWISFFADSLTYIKNIDEKARLGFLTEKLTEKDVATAKALRTGKNEVFIDTKYTKVNKKTVKMCMDEEIPLEVWTIDTEEEIVALDPYVNGITSDNLIAGKVLCQNILNL